MREKMSIVHGVQEADKVNRKEGSGECGLVV